ncbi:MAG: transglutaminase family protein [Pseudomonadota bacterium]
MKYRVTHLTEYEYDSKVSYCYNRAHLLPRETPHQSSNNSRIIIYPTPLTGNRRIDYFGNRSYHFAIQEPHDSLSIEVTTDISIKQPRKDISQELDYGYTCAQVRDQLLSPQANIETLYAREFLLNSPMIKPSPALRDYAGDCFLDNEPFLPAVMAFSSKIYKEFDFDPSVTTVATPVEEVLLHKHGVCQDFAHVAIGCLRSLGYAARYISGYLETLPPPGQQKLVGADASHAWFSVYSPGEGWFEFDPTNGTTPMYQHIVTAWGRDYSDVTPLRGIIFGGGRGQSLNVSVDVNRFDNNHRAG